MKVYNICSRETYVKDGQEKATYPQVGKLIEKDDGKMFIKLNMFPNQVFGVFEPKPKEETQNKQSDW
jgi:hypothetical protein